MRTAIVALLACWTAAGAAPSAQSLADLLASVKPAGEVLAFANDYVRVRYAVFEYPPAEPRAGEARPVVLFVRVDPEPGTLNTRPLDAPRGARLPRRRDVVPRGVRIEILKPTPATSALGEPGTDPPREATEETSWEGGRLILATFEPLHYGEGAGRFPSVTTFLSDGVVDVTAHRVRRRMGVRAGDAFWFDAWTQITVVSDYPVGAAIVQLYPGRQADLAAHRHHSVPAARTTPPGPERTTRRGFAAAASALLPFAPPWHPRSTSIRRAFPVVRS